ncbi:MAG: aminodeoxychorismate lyase [Acetatifactor sp.]|nr:aminodeoxychorismate lyase [Acetatifactor sp.]
MKAKNVIVAVYGAIFRVVVAILAAYLIYRGAEICFDYGYRIFTEPAVSAGEGRTVTVAITEDMSPADIGRLFESRGLVRDGRLFMLQYYLSEFRKDVGPGIFELSTSMTAEEMMEAMVISKEETEEE